jgi:shikimate kinase
VKKESIVLIGMAGAGKSTIGLALSRALGFNFTDLDKYILEKDGRTMQDIIDNEGEDALLQLEKRRMYEIELKRRVVAPGGSIIYHADLMAYLKQHSVLVYLDEGFEDLEGRLKNSSTRGIVGLKSKSLRQIYDERLPLYSSCADITVSSKGKTQEQLIREIMRGYKELMLVDDTDV